VNVFEFRPPLEFAHSNLFPDLFQSGVDGLGLGLGEDADLLEHGGVSHRA
jgi:hypothetical protein